MSQNDLDTLKPALETLTDAEIKPPTIPVHVALVEMRDLLEYLQTNTSTAEALSKVGVPNGTLDAFEVSIGALSTAQALWSQHRYHTKPEDLKAAQNQAFSLRDNILAAARWNLRTNPQALSVLQTIAEGSGIADMLTDLEALSVFLKNHTEAFDSDQTFNAPQHAQHALDTATELRTLIAQNDNETTSRDALDLRNRTYTYALAIWKTLREAGQYAFRNDPNTRSKFRVEHRSK